MSYFVVGKSEKPLPPILEISNGIPINQVNGISDKASAKSVQHSIGNLVKN